MAFHIVRVETEAEMRAALQHTEPPEIILADYNLPEFSGPAALQALKATNLDIPFIMLSGAVSGRLRSKSMRDGCDSTSSQRTTSRVSSPPSSAETQRRLLCATNATALGSALYAS